VFGMTDLISAEFLTTALVVVLMPGTGVIYTLSTGVFRGAWASMAAAFGCTLGIIPHLLASLLGLAALLHASAIAFQSVKILGIAYLLYLAWSLWRETGSFALQKPNSTDLSTASKGRVARQLGAIALRGILINVLNPKLSLFFLAFLPQFIPASAADVITRMSLLGVIFMALTLVVFMGYGVAANAVRSYVLSSKRATCWTRRLFAGAFTGFAIKLALTER